MSSLNNCYAGYDNCVFNIQHNHCYSCDEPCNMHSQGCGRCLREISMYGYSLREEQKQIEKERLERLKKDNLEKESKKDKETKEK